MRNGSSDYLVLPTQARHDDQVKKWTREEFRAYMAAREERIARLRAREERIRLELEVKRRQKPA
jgi:hypothetical protein